MDRSTAWRVALLAAVCLAAGVGSTFGGERAHQAGGTQDRVVALTAIVVLGVCARWISVRVRTLSILLLLQ
ncbi:hypothetical protein ACFL59_00380 [Planctomycetota bacterium]